MLCCLKLEAVDSTGSAELHHELSQMYLSQPNAFPKASVLAPACLFLAGPKGQVKLTGTRILLLTASLPTLSV